MLISAHIIKKPRRQRICDECGEVIPAGTSTLRLYGAAERYDPPWPLYLHPGCLTVTKHTGRKILDALASVS